MLKTVLLISEESGINPVPPQISPSLLRIPAWFGFSFHFDLQSGRHILGSVLVNGDLALG